MKPYLLTPPFAVVASPLAPPVMVDKIGPCVKDFCENQAQLSLKMKDGLNVSLLRPGAARSFRRLFPEESEEQGQDEADDDAGHEGKVKGKPFPLDNDVPGEPADPGDLVTQDQDEP